MLGQQPGDTDMSGFEDALDAPQAEPQQDQVFNDIYGYKCLTVTGGRDAEGNGFLKSPSQGNLWPAPSGTLEGPKPDLKGGLGTQGIHTVKADALHQLDSYRAGFHAVCKCLIWGKVVEWDEGYTSERATVVEARLYPWFDLPADMLGYPHAVEMARIVKQNYPGLHCDVAWEFDPGGDDPIEGAPRWVELGYTGDLNAWNARQQGGGAISRWVPSPGR